MSDKNQYADCEVVDTPASISSSQSNVYTCPDCGHAVSKRAKSCPYCGSPNDQFLSAVHSWRSREVTRMVKRDQVEMAKLNLFFGLGTLLLSMIITYFMVCSMFETGTLNIVEYLKSKYFIYALGLSPYVFYYIQGVRLTGGLIKGLVFCAIFLGGICWVDYAILFNKYILLYIAYFYAVYRLYIKSIIMLFILGKNSIQLAADRESESDQYIRSVLESESASNQNYL